MSAPQGRWPRNEPGNAVQVNMRVNSKHGGTAAVESAIVISLLFFLIFGIIEIARFMQVQLVLTDAAREGARLSVTPSPQTTALPTAGEIQAEVRRFLDSARIAGSTITVTPVNIATGTVTTQFTRVRVDAPHTLLTGLGWFSGLEVTLSGTALMRNETSP